MNPICEKAESTGGAPFKLWFTLLLEPLVFAAIMSAIAGGLTFATALTLVLAPCLLLLGQNIAAWSERRRAARRRAPPKEEVRPMTAN